MPAASLVVKLSAQIAEFQKSFDDAIRTTSQFEKKYAGLASSVADQQQRINKAFASFAGDNVIRDANALAAAITKVGGAAKLTESEQRRVNASVTEALEKYKALGQQAPASLQALANATKQLEQPTTFASKAMGVLTSSFGQFTAAGLAVKAIDAVVGKVGEFVAAGSKLPTIEGSFNRLAKTVGQDSQTMLAALQTGTRGMVSNLDLMQSANKAVLLGLPVTSKEMGELARTATVLGRAMGQDATSSLNDLITALGRSSPLILDNLGLTVKVGEANETYARKLGKTAEQLTDSEKKMAFYNAAMEAARKKTAELGDQTKTLGDIFDTAWVSIGNVITRRASDFNVGVGKILSDSKALMKFLEDTAAFGSAMAVRMAAERERALAQSATGPKPDIKLPSSAAQQIKALSDEAKALTATALKPLTEAQRELTLEFTKGGKSAKDIAEKLNAVQATAGVSEVQIQKLLDTQKKSVKEAEGYADALKRVAAAQIPLTADQIKQIDNLLKLNIAHSDIAKVVRVSEVAVDSYADAQKRSNDILKDFAKIVAGSNAELGKMPGQVIAITKQFTDLSQLLPPIALKMQEIVGAFGVGEVISPFKLSDDFFKDLDQGIADFDKAAQKSADDLHRKFDDVANTLRNVGSLFGNLAGEIITGSADIVSGIGDIITATTAWGKAIAIVNLAINAGRILIGLFRDEAHEATNDIRDDFLATFGPGGTGPGSGFSNLAARLNEVAGGAALFDRLLSAKTPEDFARAMDAVNEALSHTPEALAAAAGFKTREELQATADEARKTYEYMRDSGKYTAEQIAQAFERSRNAQIAALDDVQRAALESNQKIVNDLKTQIQKLDSEHDSIFASWKAEDDAPEFDAAGNRIFGVIEQQQRARLDQIEAERKKAEEALIAANAKIDESFAGLGPAASDAATAIEMAFKDFSITIPIHFDPDDAHLLSGTRLTIPAFADGAYVRKPTLALIGEKGPEYVTPAAQMNAIRSRNGSSSGIVFQRGAFEGMTVDSQERVEQLADAIFTRVRRGGAFRTKALASLGIG